MKASIRNLPVFAATALAMTMTMAACGGGSGGGYMAPTPPANTAPGISAVTDRISDQDTAVSVDFTVQDRETAAGSLTVSAAADGTGVFPADGVVLTGSGSTRTLTLTPLEATTGTATISLRVTDPEGMATTRSFQVAINARNNSMRSMTLDTFAKTEADAALELNGWTVQQDADDPAVFAALIPAGEE
jgi:hypothetical protein